MHWHLVYNIDVVNQEFKILFWENIGHCVINFLSV